MYLGMKGYTTCLVFLVCLILPIVVNSSTTHTEEKDIGKGHKNSFTFGDVRWEIWEDQITRNKYYYDTVNQKSQWMDPRALAARGNLSATILTVVFFTFVGFFSYCVLRIAYLWTSCPELLWPTKERKIRKKRVRNKDKAMRHRFKVSQGGKGGRSANS